LGSMRAGLGRQRWNRGRSLDERRCRHVQRLRALSERFCAMLRHPRTDRGVGLPRSAREMRRAIVPSRAERSTPGDDEQDQQTAQDRVGFREPSDQLERRESGHGGAGTLV
ncbi:MAG TPA: hypothetical protein VNN72_12095, partial [Polyangiaceae bacterium]|nr:hypothetical protein [Polyangiaceae bacterium]